MSDERRAPALFPTPESGRESRGRKLAKAGIAVLIGVGIGLALWEPLRLDERSHIEHVAKLAARSLQADIAADLESEILAVIRLAQVATFEEKPSHQAWLS